MNSYAEIRRKILQALSRRMEAPVKSRGAKDGLELHGLTDLELEVAVEQTVRVREEAEQLRREVFQERTSRRVLKGGGQ